MRIIAGTHRGRRLASVPARGIRPTADRVRESIFNILRSDIAGARVLDLFAGTGALGLEALSRGAGHAVFVDVSSQACRTIQENIHRCREEDHTRIIRHDMGKKKLPGPMMVEGPFSLIFMDPPYGRDLVRRVLTDPSFAALIAPGARVVVEHAKDRPLPDPLPGLDILDQRQYGKTRVSFLIPL